MDLPQEPGSLWGIRVLPFCALFSSVFPGLCILSCGRLNVSLEFRPEAHVVHVPGTCRVTELIFDLDEGVLNALSSSFNTG